MGRERLLAVAVQPEVKAHYVTGRSVKAQRKENLEHYSKLIDDYVLAAEHRCGGKKPGLMVFPENFIGGFGPQRLRTWESTLELSIEIPGEETEILGRKCREHGLYLAGANNELPNKELPENIYLTGFIIDPDGKVAFKYRKINAGPSTGIAFTTSPHDIWDKVSHDPKDLFPVLETPYGFLGMYICYDSHFPEVARCLALNGAEILIHPSQWYEHTYRQIEYWRMRNRCRALENLAYVIATNWAASPESEYPFGCGHAMIVDHRGDIMEEIPNDQESFCCAVIDIDTLRERRLSNDISNYLKSLRTEAYAAVYGNKTCWEPALLSQRGSLFHKYEDLWAQKKKIEARLKKEGVLH